MTKYINGLQYDSGSGGGSVATDTIWNAAGDIVVGTANDAATVLPIGTEGYVLKVVSGTPAWSAGGGSSAYVIQRSLEGVVYETTLMYWAAPATCTISAASMSLASAPATTGSYCKVQVMKNGVLETNSIFSADTPMQITETTSATNGIYQASGTLDSGQTTLAAGDILQFRVNQADTGSADLLVQVKVAFS